MKRGQPDNAELRAALYAGDPAVVRRLLDAGADLRYRDANGYDALIHAVHGRDVLRDPRLLELLRLLVEGGVALSGVTSYSESALQVLSRIGRFDGVELLLNAGADECLLAWTPLHLAVASGTLDGVRRLLDGGASLHARDTWERTPWLIALLIGDIGKAGILIDGGAYTGVTGRCGQPPLFYAIEGHHPAMVRWLLDYGVDVRQTDDFGTTALIEAVKVDDLEIVDLLIEAGADVDIDSNGTALNRVGSRAIAMRLLEARADPATLSHGGQRILLGLGDVTEEPLSVVSRAQFHQASTRTFGETNPQRMNHPFWLAMIRAGVDGYTGANHFGNRSGDARHPVWCAQRNGQSLTFLPDGRAVQIAGEHEDHYDPDFCIYNDVFVHHPDGSIDIFGYPKEIFPPTDFHTATLLGDRIYIIGSVGYRGIRGGTHTPVYKLDLSTWQMKRVESTGDSPGWLFRHRAERINEREIRVSSGSVITLDDDGKEETKANADVFVFDTFARQWRRDV